MITIRLILRCRIDEDDKPDLSLITSNPLYYQCLKGVVVNRAPWWGLKDKSEPARTARWVVFGVLGDG
jgi:hypothetical protein